MHHYTNTCSDLQGVYHTHSPRKEPSNTLATLTAYPLAAIRLLACCSASAADRFCPDQNLAYSRREFLIRFALVGTTTAMCAGLGSLAA